MIDSWEPVAARTAPRPQVQAGPCACGCHQPTLTAHDTAQAAFDAAQWPDDEPQGWGTLGARLVAQQGDDDLVADEPNWN